jgi:CHASE3 domain sensor protein
MDGYYKYLDLRMEKALGEMHEAQAKSDQLMDRIARLLKDIEEFQRRLDVWRAQIEETRAGRLQQSHPL